MSLRCFIQTLVPVPGSAAQSVRYPVCEWVGEDGVVDHQHPLNRFVCSWLTSDLADVTRCDEVLEIVAQLESATRKEWFVDGDAFNVDMQAAGVQFNQSNVSSEDAAHWNQPQGRFTLLQMTTLLRVWRDFLAAPEPR
jgi:Uncharacterised protein family (UPF0231)